MTADDADTPPTPAPEGGAAGRYPRPTVDLDEAEWVWRDLAARATRVPVRDEEVRLAVIAGLARCTGARYGDLLRVTVEDVVLDPPDAGTGAASGGRPVGGRVGGGVVRVRHGKHRTVRDHPVGRGAAVVLARWLEVREELCADLEGSVPRALLLTVHHTHDNGVTVSKGLPITAQGLVLSWRRYVHRTAAEQGARRRPLPTRFEQVRRAWVAARAAADDGR
ncbi:tyrosine-type recombinase/integrase [Luteimicrobium sp. DT211]|uniref:tyrosine-type recombinase/integrase n=1 Tax=Luteimicrobium sp. DT211 TaxID=3393412 RepID=UPI003CF9B472